MEYNLNFIVLFMDYEKAFDYANRYELIKKLMSKQCGSKFTNAIAKMYTSTTYIPYVNNKMGEPIKTSYGVAQGRNSSPDFYSFYVADMPRCTEDLPNEDFMDPHVIAQLADDTAMLTEQLHSFKRKTACLLEYSKENYQVPNIPKTVYCHFSKDPNLTPISIDDNISISSVDPKKGHRYLGFKFLPTNDFSKIIKHNLDDRKGRVSKFYAWLEDNRNTPIEIKLLVLDNCLFSSLLYSVETWGDISIIEMELRKIELKALKAILQIKSGTSTDIVYNELRRPDIISRIKESQFHFFKKINEFEIDDAMVVSVLDLCKDTSIVQYYKSLHDHNKKDNIDERTRRIMSSEAPMLENYRNNVEIETKPMIYSSYMNDGKRKIISRWRLSNHKLNIELGRYSTPKIPREDRKCLRCDVVEDEFHAIFVCPTFHLLRVKYDRIILKYSSVKTFLNPEYSDLYDVANYLEEIEEILGKR